MQIQLIRNATMRIHYAGHLILTDPDLAPKHSRPSFTGASPNPLVDLPCTQEEVVAQSELVLISHLHQDHFDTVARQILPRDIQIFCQPGDEAKIAKDGFEQITPVAQSIIWNDITITRTRGRHGTSDIEQNLLGQVSGFVLQHANEPTLYWAGDTILCDFVEQVIGQIQPDVILTHSSGAVWAEGAPIVMDGQQTIHVCQIAPESVVVAIHLDSLDHGTVSRTKLRELADEHQITDKQLLIPQDGETLELTSGAL